MKLKVILVLIFLLILLIVQFSSAIRINEVELNPLGDDSGNEWIELYSGSEINLTNYFLKNSDNQTINLSGTFSNYFIYIFPKQWLDNSNEKIYLYLESVLIDETSVLNDDKNNDQTWSYCNSEWVLISSSKNLENSCSPPPSNSSSSSNITKSKENITIQTSQEPQTPVGDYEFEGRISVSSEKSSQNVNLSPISLNAQTIKTEKSSDFENKTKGKYSIYLLITFCVLLLFLFLLRKRKYNKNEFN